MLFLDKTIEIFPAYGRLYKTQKKFKDDFLNYKDFRMENGLYMAKDNISFMIKDDVINVFIRIKNSIVYVIRNNTIQNWVDK